MNFSANLPFAGEARAVLDRAASALIIAGFDIETRSPAALEARRRIVPNNEDVPHTDLAATRRQFDEYKKSGRKLVVGMNWGQPFHRDKSLFAIDRIQLRYEAAALWIDAESKGMSYWKWYAMAVMVGGSSISIWMIHLLLTGQMKDDDDGHVISSHDTGYWIFFGLVALAVLATPKIYSSMVSRTQRAVTELLHDLADAADESGGAS